jgi:hypothetical protein
MVMSRTRITQTNHQRRVAAAERLATGTQVTREHGQTPDSIPNYGLRKLAAIGTLAVVVWNGAEATDYGDKIPVVKDVKDSAGLVIDTMVTNIDNGPSNPEVVNEEWRKLNQNIIGNIDQGPSALTENDQN